MKRYIVFILIFSILASISSAQTSKEALFKFCSEIENLDMYQRIVNFTELPMDKSLVKDLLFLKNPEDSYTYVKTDNKLTRINTIIDANGKNRFVAYLSDDKVYKYSNEFVFKSKKLYLDIKKKQKKWKDLLKKIPESKTLTKKIDNNGKLEISHWSKYKGFPLKIEITIKSHLSKIARVKVLFGG